VFDITPLFISLKAATLSSVLVFVLGTLVAKLCYTMRGRKAIILDTIFSLPLVLPPTVLGFFLLVLLGRNGPIGILLAKLGLKGVILHGKPRLLRQLWLRFP